MKIFITTFILLMPCMLAAQGLQWENVDKDFGQLPSSVHIYFTDKKIDTANFRAYYLIADLKDKRLNFTTDTSHNRRLTPAQFFDKNAAPIAVVNGTFFSFESNKNLNLVINNGKLVSFNAHYIAGRGKDTLTFRHHFTSAIGINKKRKADVAWTITDTASNKVYALQTPLKNFRDSTAYHSINDYKFLINKEQYTSGHFVKEWKMQTAIGGGPVLIQNGEIKITNNEELKFPGKGIMDKHPRTAMGYTKNGHLIILVVEGRNKDAGGATLLQLAQVLKELGCIEALNLDGGGSSCLLVNGKETIKPSDKDGQRPVPAVFIIRRK